MVPAALSSPQACVPDELNASYHEDDSAEIPVSGAKTVRSRLLRQGAWVVVGRGLGIGTAMAISVILARVLPPGDVGVFFLLASILSFTSFLAMFGLNAGMIRFVSESLGLGDTQQARTALRLGLRVAGVSIVSVSLVCWLFMGLWGSTLFGIPHAGVLVPLLAVSVIASAALQLCASILRSFHEACLSTLLTGQFGGPLSNLMFLALLLIAALIAGPTVTTAMSLNAISMFALLPAAVAIVIRIGRASFRQYGSANTLPVESQPLALSTLLAVCLPLTLTQGLSYLTGQSDIWIAGSLVSHDQVALYGAARRLMLLIGMPMQLVNLTVVATIAELRAQGRLAELQRILRTTATLATLPALFVLVPLLFAPGEIASLVFGAYYRDSGTALRLLALGQLVFTCVGSAELTLMMTGHQKSALAINVVTSILIATLGTVMTVLFGIVGLAGAWSAVIVLQCSLFCMLARRRVGVWTCFDYRLLIQGLSCFFGRCIKTSSASTTTNVNRSTSPTS
jgi:O-antigen/teichoic acid export membrane protein